jgi:choline dehydrogenase-like flavoprotein
MAGNEKVDVLIIGAGASGAAVAWSLAETKMRILCLEQGDWMNPTDYPSTAATGRRDDTGDFEISPNRRGAGAPTTRSTTTTRRSPSPTSTAWAAARALHRRTSRACIRRTSRCASLDGVADDWPIDYQTLDRSSSPRTTA